MDFSSDISPSLAVAAFSGVSMNPEGRGERTRNEYTQTLAQDYENFKTQAIKGGTLDAFEAEFAQYRAGYSKRYRAYVGDRNGTNCGGLPGIAADNARAAIAKAQS